jgi:hypothetical protein
MHLIVFANPLQNDFATSVNHPLMRWYPSYPMASGRCCAPGCARTVASRRRSCPPPSASFSSSTIPAGEAKRCSAPSLLPSLHDQTTTPQSRKSLGRMAAVPAMDGLAQRVTNRTRCFNSCWLDSNMETARISMHHLRDAAVRDQDEFMHALLYVASLIATSEVHSQPSTQSTEEPKVSAVPKRCVQGCDRAGFRSR